MNFQIPQNIKSLTGSLGVAAILLLAIFWGNSSGQQLAQSEIIAQTAQNAANSLQFFYQDQDRFPTPLEFSDQNIMLNYLSSFPLPRFLNKVCSESFVYKKIDANNFQLNFCIPTSIKGYEKGWNSIKGTPAPVGQ